MEVPRAQRLERPGWLNGRTLLGLLLFSISLLGGQKVIESYRTTTTVWAAGADLPTGTVLDAGDLKPLEVGMSPEVLSLYALSGTSIEGAVLTEAISRGELIPLGAVAPSGTEVDGRLLSVPVQADHAVGGALGPGDLVDLFVTYNSGDARATTVQLAAGVEVIDVLSEDSIVTGKGLPVAVTLLVPPSAVADIVHAARTGELDLVRVTGEPSLELADPVGAEGDQP